MFYFKRIEDGALFASTMLPVKPEKFIELTEEEYIALTTPEEVVEEGE